MRQRAEKLILSLLLCTLLAACGMPDTKFSLNDVGSITAIELSQDTIHIRLNRTDSCWMVNDEYVAGEEQLSMLLYFLNTQAALAPLAESNTHEAEAALNQFGIRIKAYNGRTLLLDFEAASTDSLGYFARVSGKKNIYVLQQPNADEDNPFSYFNPLASFWRHNVIISVLPSDIVSLTVDNLDNPEQSFQVRQIADGSLQLIDMYNNQQVEHVNLSKLHHYLSYFNGVSYDRMLDLTDGEQKAILLSSSPYSLKLEARNGEKITLQAFYIQGEEFDPYGNPIDYDPNKFHLAMNNGQDIALAYWVDFDLLFKDLDVFVEK